MSYICNFTDLLQGGVVFQKQLQKPVILYIFQHDPQDGAVDYYSLMEYRERIHRW